MQNQIETSDEKDELLRPLCLSAEGEIVEICESVRMYIDLVQIEADLAKLREGLIRGMDS